MGSVSLRPFGPSPSRRWRKSGYKIFISYLGLSKNIFRFVKKYKSMFSITSFWFEISIVTFFFLLGHIFLGHFEERAPKLRKLIKYIVTLGIVLSLSYFFGRAVAFGVLGVG